MNWPVSQDYNEAVQNPVTSFSDTDLKKGEVVLNSLGLPVPRSGNFADVYEFKGGDGKKWALKCFTRKVAGLQERYAKIDEHLSKAQFPFTVGFKYMAEGIRIRGQWFPLLKMEWVEGFTLNEFIRDNADKKQYLHALMQMWGKLTALLRDGNFAHADLQHGNVLLVPATTGGKLGLRLIDYDGMWVPALAETHSGEVGHPNFQHPLRLKDRLYNADVDRFPHLVIAAALRATLLGGKALWTKFDNGDNLLFKEGDLRDPANAQVFKTLWDLHDDVLCTLVGKIVLATQEPLRRTPWLDDLLLTDEGKRLNEVEEAKVLALLGVDPHFTAAKSAVAPTAAQNEFDVFAFEDEPATSAPTKSGTHKAKPAKDEPKPKKKAAKEEKAKSKMPLYIGGGVAAVALIVGIIIATSGKKDKPSQPEVVKGDDKSPPREQGKNPPPKVVVPPPKKDTVTDTKVDNPPKKNDEPPAKKDPEVVAKKDPQGGVPGEPRLMWKMEAKVTGQSLAFSEDSAQILRSCFGPPHRLFVQRADDGAELAQMEQVKSDAHPLGIRTGPEAALVLTMDTNRVIIQDRETQKVRADFEIPKGSGAVAIAKDRNVCFAPLSEDEIGVYSLRDGSRIESLKLPQADSIRSIDCSPDGKTIVAFTSHALLYAKTDGQPDFKLIFKGPATGSRKVKLSPNLALVAVAFNNQLRILETATGKEHRNLNGHATEVRGAYFTPDGKHLLSFSRDKMFRTWDIEAGTQLHSVDVESPVRAAALSPDGATVAIATDDFQLRCFRLTYSSGNAVAKLPDPEPKEMGKKDPVIATPDQGIGQLKRLWQDKRSMTNANGSPIDITPDGKYILVRMTNTQSIQVLRLVDGVKESEFECGIVNGCKACSNNVLLVNMVGKGKDVIAAYDYKTGARLYELASGHFIRHGWPMEDDNLQTIRHGDRAILAINVKDGTSAGNNHTFDASIVRCTQSLDRKFNAVYTNSGDAFIKRPGSAVFQRTYLADAKLVVTGQECFSINERYAALAFRDNTIHIFDSTTGKELKTLEGHTQPAQAVQFTTNPRYLITASDDQSLRVWDVETAKLVQNHDLNGRVKAFVISRDGQNICIPTNYPEGLQVWKFDRPPEIKVVKKNVPEPMPMPMPKSPDELAEVWKGSAGSFLNSLSFSQDGSRLAISSRSMEVSLLDARNGSLVGRQKVSETPIGALTFAANNRVFAVDNDRRLIGWDLTGKAKLAEYNAVCSPMQFPIAADTQIMLLPQPMAVDLYSLADNKKVGSLPLTTKGEVTWMSVTPDGDHIVLITTIGEVFTKGKDADGFKLLTSILGSGQRRVAIAPDGKIFAFSNNKEPIRILDTADGKELKTLEGHSDEILAIQFLPDGNRLMSLSRDNTLRLWNVEEGKQLFEAKLGVGSALAMAVSPDGKSVAVGGSGGTQLWRFGGDVAVTKKDPAPKVTPPVDKKGPALAKEPKEIQAMLARIKAVGLAELTIDDARFQDVKTGVNGKKKIFGDPVPGWLEDRTFHFKGGYAGYTQFTVDTNGIVMMACSPRYKKSGNSSGNWEPELLYPDQLTAAGWKLAGTLQAYDLDCPLYWRECKKGESLKIRTDKYLAPLIIK